MATGASSIIYMVVAMAFIGSVIALEAVPVRIVQMHLLAHTSPDLMEWAIIALSLVLIVLVVAASIVIPMRKGIHALEKMDF